MKTRTLEQRIDKRTWTVGLRRRGQVDTVPGHVRAELQRLARQVRKLNRYDIALVECVKLKDVLALLKDARR